MRKIGKYTCLVLMLSLLLAAFTGCSSSAAVEPETVPTTQAPTEIAEPETTVPTEPEKKEMSTPDLAEYVQKRTVTVSVKDEAGNEATGSGFFIDDQGTIVTNYHVIDAAKEISVKVSDGGVYDVKKIVDFSDIHDIAVLKLDLSGNDYLEICPENCRTGETVYAVGSSLGFLDGTFSNGIISNASRTVGIIDCVQTTAAISNGNSGGPLVNVYGEVIGINAFAYDAGENLNLAISMDTLDELTMDKDWNINKYREWYKKEIERSYNVYNYTQEQYYLSKINTYQHITGEECYASSFDFKFLEGDFNNVLQGYHDTYGVYWYEYHVEQFDQYTDYLNEIGFSFLESQDYEEGISYYYENEFTGYRMDIFIMEGQDYMMIEPYCY